MRQAAKQISYTYLKHEEFAVREGIFPETHYLNKTKILADPLKLTEVSWWPSIWSDLKAFSGPGVLFLLSKGASHSELEDFDGWALLLSLHKKSGGVALF